MKKIFTLLFTTALIIQLSANNINISNVALTGKNTTAGVNNAANYTLIQFDISWDNSFRVTTGPANRDAAWVFIKYRVAGGTWQHAWLNDAGHTAPAGSIITPGLVTPGVAFDPTTNPGIGAFIYRDATGSGTFNKTGVQLRWNYGANGIADNAVVDIQIFSVEMVYVPQGAFSLGSGGNESGAFYKYPTISNPYLVSSEAAIPVGTTTDNLYYQNSSGLSGDQTGPIPAEFPKGYDAFYCMKYEITQQQYVDFLNSLTYNQQVARTIISPNSATGTYVNNYNRYKIKISKSGTVNSIPAVYTTDYPCVACNFLSWADLAAYLDWSGLRPMTELEFEKACRGIVVPVANEFAWGTNTMVSSPYTLNNSGAANETIATNYGTTVGNAINQTTAGGISGPLRVGIFAGTSGNTDRITAGATFYGIMEMSGNLWERPVAAGNPTGRSFTGTHGNGTIDATGNADVISWSGTDALGISIRGGDWYSNQTACVRVSDRYYAMAVNVPRFAHIGGRGVRLAP